MLVRLMSNDENRFYRESQIFRQAVFPHGSLCLTYFGTVLFTLTLMTNFLTLITMPNYDLNNFNFLDRSTQFCGGIFNENFLRFLLSLTRCWDRLGVYFFLD